MSKFVRQSKLRNVYGQAFKKDQCFDSIRISKNSNTHMFCAVNPEFVAVVIHAEGGGQFMVLTHQETGRVDMSHPSIVGHRAAVIDIAWSPFDDHLIASSDDNGCIMIWEVPEGGVKKNLEEGDALVAVQEHQKRCNLLKWHPLASNIILSCAADNRIILWNMDEGEPVSEYKSSNVIQDLSWSPDGKTFASASKDKVIRIHDGPTCEELQVIPGHSSPRDMRLCLLKGDRLLSTGFSRDSVREYRLWDLNKLDEPMYEDALDVTNAPLNIFYDPDIGLVYLVGKGDSVFRYYEVNDQEPYFHYITTYQSSTPQRGMGFMPKRGCNVNACEVARLYKVIVGSGSVGSLEPISMIVPRKSDLFQDDVFPDTASNEPSLSADEWLAGKEAVPKLMDMKQFFVEKEASSSSKGGLKKGGLKGGLKKKDEPKAAKVEPRPAPTSTVKAAAPAASTPSSFKPQTKEDQEEPKAPEPKPEPKVEPKSEPKPEPKPQPKVEKKQEPKSPSTPSADPPAPKSPTPKSQPKKDATPKPSITPKSPTTPKPAATPDAGKMNGKLSASDILMDIKNLRNTVSRHEASIASLEELQLSQNKEMQDLIAEIANLKATVAEQEKRIAALEAR